VSTVHTQHYTNVSVTDWAAGSHSNNTDCASGAETSMAAWKAKFSCLLKPVE